MRKLSRVVQIVTQTTGLFNEIKGTLEKRKYQLVVSENAEEGLTSAKQFQPHLILVDLTLPNKTAVSLIKEIRTLGALKNIPVIVIFDEEDNRDLEEDSDLKIKALEKKLVLTKAIGANDFVERPISGAILLQKVSSLLSQLGMYSAQFEKGAHKVQAKFESSTRISMINELSFILEAPVRFAPSTIMNISSPTIKQFGLEKETLHRTTQPAGSAGEGRYSNRISFVSISRDALKTLKRKLGIWT